MDWKQMLAKLSELTPDELVELTEALDAAFDEAKASGTTPEIVAELTEIVEAKESVTAETVKREQAEAEAAEAIADLERRMTGEAEEATAEGDENTGDGDESTEGGEGEGDDNTGEGETTEGGESGEGEGTGTGEGEGGESTEGGEGESTEEATEVTSEEKELVTADAGKKASLGAIGKRVPTSARSAVRTKPRMPKMYGANGKKLNGMIDIAKELISAHDTFGHVVGGISENLRVVKIEGEYAKDRQLSKRNDPEQNSAIIAAAMLADEEAIVASGGLCAPTTPYYDMANISSADRPVRQSLTQLNATRGGINFVEPGGLADVAGSFTLWTHENDADETPSPATKACLAIDCGDPVEVQIDALVYCLQFGNMGARAFPENVAQKTALALAYHARQAESRALDQIKALSTEVTVDAITLGAVRDLLYSVEAAAAGIRNRNRTAQNARFRVWLPEWAINLVRSDIARSLPAYEDQLGMADAKLAQWFGVRGISPTYYKDSPSSGTSQYFGVQGETQLLDFPDAIQWGIAPDDTFSFLDGGELNLGVVRDSTLNETNDYQIFAETFEAVARTGVDVALWVEQELCASGAATGTVEPGEICAGPYVPSESE